MPKVNVAGASIWVPDEIGQERDDLTSAGISSSTSESKQDKSGVHSGTGPQSPAPETDSPSSRDLLKNQESSTAPSTGGSGQGTSSGQQNRQTSSAGSPQGVQATQGSNKSGNKRASSS